ncbi:MAG: arginine--tRNA ligase [Terriglobia bacterium]
MYLQIQQRVREKFVQAVRDAFGIEVAEPVLGFPPSVDLGELSITSCFELARQLRQSPRKIAEQVAPRLLPIEGVDRVSIAGAGYLNVHLDRAALAAEAFVLRSSGEPGPATQPRGRQPAAFPAGGKVPKVLVEHTSINPNKAAHIGHLRNSVLGDTFVRLLRFRGQAVEIQNYIDNTGVQVADVIVGFRHLERKGLEDVRRLIADPNVRFDYYCWDLYARVFQYYQSDKNLLALRGEILKAVEEGHGDVAAMAELVSTAIVRAHLETMLRIGVRYDLLVGESEILRLHFWKYAFELMQERKAIWFEEAGKNRGCWVMRLEEGQPSAGDTQTPAPANPPSSSLAAGEEEEASPEGVKIIVRSNGTVTYVGKDIAYHLWKFGLLDRDFGYEPFYRYADGHTVWRTSSDPAEGGSQDREDTQRHEEGNAREADGSRLPSADRLPPLGARPGFGRASAAYAVIDTRQSYLQNVVVAAFHALGYHEQAQHLHHFAYEVVGLSPGCAHEMGYDVSDEGKGYVEVSGRKGLGIKADDLIDRLIDKALEEVSSREVAGDEAEQRGIAGTIAVAALRYFLLKFSRNVIIAFDFKEALAFEGETGPYLQYTVVRARNIFRKFDEAHPGWKRESLGNAVRAEQLNTFLSGDAGRDFWEMALVAAQLEMFADQAIAAEEPAVVAKYAFRQAQAFNNFYHHHRILAEADAERQQFLLYLVCLVSQTLAQALDLLGINVPERM